MGNSSGRSDLDAQRIAEIAMEVNQQFSKDFMLCFQDTIAKTIKTTYLNNTQQGKYRLQQFDSPTRDVKEGYLEKLGGNVKSWHRRYFIATNKASNFVIIYFDDAEHMREKGRVKCCGYRAEAFGEEDMLKYGPYGIKLVPYAAHKRQWYFRASKELEQMEWIEAFSNACKKADPEPLLESVYQQSFLRAFKLTKAAYGYFGASLIFDNASEMLEFLVTQLLSRELLDTYIADNARSQSNDNAQSKALSITVHHQVKKIVHPMAINTWNNVYKAASEMRGSYELQVKTSLGIIAAKEGELVPQLDKKIQRIVRPFFAELERNVCVPVLSCCFEDIVQAHVQALIGMQELFQRLIIACNSTELLLQSISTEMQSLESAIESTIIASPLTASQKLLWMMQSQDLSDIQEILDTSGVLPFDIYSDVMVALKRLCHNANYTLCLSLSAAAVTASDAKASSNSELFTQATISRTVLLDKLSMVMLQMEHDAAESLHEVVSQLLTSCMECTVQESMIAPSYEEVLSVKHLVTRDMEHLINLNMIGEDLVRVQITAFINAVIEDQMKEARARLRQISSALFNDTLRHSSVSSVR